MWYDEDFYSEPSEFDMQIEEFKESLSKSVKKEYLEEMEKLRKENQALWEVKKNFEQIKREYENKKHKLEIAVRDAENKAKRMRAEEIMENYKVFFWRQSFEYKYGPKCDKCDKNRQIEVSLPSGRKVNDDCECRKTQAKVAVPERMVRYELADRQGKIVAWYKSCGKEEERYYCIDYASTVYADSAIVEPGTSFDALLKKESKEILFQSREECMAYCEYLNEINQVPYDAVYKCNGERYTEKEE